MSDSRETTITTNNQIEYLRGSVCEGELIATGVKFRHGFDMAVPFNAITENIKEDLPEMTSINLGA